MAIISGVNVPDNKRLEVALTRVYGIGPKVAKDIIEKAGIFDNPRVKDLPEADLNRVREIIDADLVVEGDLRRDVNQNIRRLIDIGCYRGTRHRKSLPTRGQRTKTNARAKRGRRMAISRKKE